MFRRECVGACACACTCVYVCVRVRFFLLQYAVERNRQKSKQEKKMNIASETNYGLKLWLSNIHIGYRFPWETVHQDNNTTNSLNK